MTTHSTATAEAFANIALVKYWGKLERDGNYPAVPSLSLTLSGLRTVTRVTLTPELSDDVVYLDEMPTTGRPRERVVRLLDELRTITGNANRARVDSNNDFPTAAGLASSASGFAALACAANAAFGAPLSREQQSAMARRASASAARSLFGGFATLDVGAESATELVGPEYWDLVLLVAVTTAGKKPIGSTEAMNLTRATSPYYPAWVANAPALFSTAKQAVVGRDIEALGAAMEQSTLMMHATMHAATPAVIYQLPTTLAVIHEVRALRAAGTACFFTMDAGPHVKVLCERSNAKTVRARLEAIAGVCEVLEATPGPRARILDETP
ncbi:MAG: diphosphomevalonate decarboxylase [Polyangiaceae bacterium]